MSNNEKNANAKIVLKCTAKMTIKNQMKNHQNAVNNHPADWRDFFNFISKNMHVIFGTPNDTIIIQQSK